MQHADKDTVLGDFDEVSFSHAGKTSRFFSKDGRYLVNTDGLDGESHDYEISYTFGVFPLQQYLVDIGRGRLQALPIAWDARPAEEGGQRWFHLYPDEQTDYRDELHWTRSSHNWNGMCAACHSTGLHKNYDSSRDAFETGWTDIDVSCEACHGPASKHVEWAVRDDREAVTGSGFGLSLDERKGIVWQMKEGRHTATRNRPRATEKEIEACAPCHSRRSTIAEGFEPGKPLLDFYLPQLLSENMYFVDGQVQDEVFVYGSFLQSRMYQAGVTCSDCHEPHSLQLRHEENAVCTQCHEAAYYDAPSHHHHKEDSQGARCAECHMPPRTYMVVDPRHDHSFRIPRPDLSVALGVPNACNNCHDDESEQWAADKTRQWYGGRAEGYQRYAQAFDAARKSQPGAGPLLRSLIDDPETPDIARATAVRELAAYMTPAMLEAVTARLSDGDPLVRYAGISALAGLPAPILVEYLFPMMHDPVRTVRIEAARVLASVPVGRLDGVQKEIYERATSEYIDSQSINADRPQAQANLGNFHLARGETDTAIAAYRKAIALDDAFIPAYINLADLYRTLDKNDDAQMILDSALNMAPDSAIAWHSLGLVQVRQQKLEPAVASLSKAVELDGSNTRYAYVYAIALNSTGEAEKAIEVMRGVHELHPDNVEVLQALVAFHRDAGNAFAAAQYMNTLKRLMGR